MCDLYISHTPSTLSLLAPGNDELFQDYTSWLESHADIGRLPNFNREWASLGFMRWKALLLKSLMSDVPKGAMVMYHDVDCIKYPQYLVGVESWPLLSEALLSEVRSDIFMPYEDALLEVGCKRFLLDKYGVDGVQPSLWSGVFIFRNSDLSMRFISEWLSMSTLENSAPIPDEGGNDRFFWHSPDQSIATVLSLLWKDAGVLDRGWPMFHFVDRVISEKTLVRFS